MKSRLPTSGASSRQFLDAQFKLLSTTARQRTPDYLVARGYHAAGPARNGHLFSLIRARSLRPQIVAAVARFLKQRAAALTRCSDPGTN